MSKASDRTIAAILFNSKQPFFVVYSLTPLSKCLEYLLFYTINMQERIPFLTRTKKGEISSSPSVSIKTFFGGGGGN